MIAALVLLALPTLAAVPRGDIETDLALLASPAASERAAALERLVAEGSAAANAALEGLAFEGLAFEGPAFEGLAEAPPEARRARAELVRRAGGAEQVAAAAERVLDPDPAVSLALVAFLGRPDLGGETGAVRAAALAGVVNRGNTASLRSSALEALAGLASTDAARELDGLLGRLPGAEQEAAAAALAGMPAGREALLARVRAAAAGEGGLGGPALAALLPAFGEALADAVLPAAAAGGEAELERALAPLLVLAVHRDPACRAAAAEARGKLLDRLMVLSRSELLLRVLDALVAAGWDRREADLRLAWLALTRGADPADALPAARRLATSPGRPAESGVRLWRLYGSMLEAAVLLADRRPGEAHGALDRAERVAAGLVAERLDLRPSPSDPSPRFGDLAVERAHLAGVVELLRTACLLEEGRASADLLVLEAARRAHARSLEAQLLARRADAQVSASTLDALLDRELAPRRLVLANGRNARWTRAEQLDLYRRLLETLASVAPGEMPGISAAEDLPADIADPLADPERLELLQSIHLAEVFVFDRRELELRERLEQLRRAGVAQDDTAWRRLARELQRLYELRVRHQDDVDRWRDPPEGEAPDLEQLLLARGPSAAPLTLALDMRAEGRPREAIEIAEGMLAALDDPRYAALEWMRAFTGARLLLCIGGGFTDDDLPEQAEEKLLAAVDRLVELESGIRDALDGLPPEEASSVRAGYEANLAATERLRGQVLVSLAVNANVKMGDVERALEYFDRAYELDQSDFMKVLRGCYRARVGRAEEARKVLLEVQVAPELYYNMACTWALLGEDELALDFLTRELAENHPTPGSHERQREWAASDPDLESLRDDPRFRRLVDTPLGGGR